LMLATLRTCHERAAQLADLRRFTPDSVDFHFFHAAK
jgi:hypothetical protein